MMTTLIRRRPPVARAAMQGAVGKVFVGAFVAASVVCLGMASSAHAVPVFRDGFESGTTHWTLGGNWGLVLDAHSGVHSLGDNPSGASESPASSSASMAIDVNFSSATTAASFSSWTKGHVNAWGMDLDASTDGGNTWTTCVVGTPPSNWIQGIITPNISGNFGALLGQSAVRFRYKLAQAGAGADSFQVDDIVIDDGRAYATLTTPIGGELWSGNAVHSITWRNNGVIDQPASFRLLYSTDGGSSYPNLIVTGIPSTATSYAWSVPAIDTSNARIQIDALDSSGNLMPFSKEAATRCSSMAVPRATPSTPPTRLSPTTPTAKPLLWEPIWRFARSSHGKSLDDWMRAMWRNHPDTGKPYTLDDLPRPGLRHQPGFRRRNSREPRLWQGAHGL